MLTIRNATLADIPLIRELTFQVWPQTYTRIVGAEQVAYMLEMMYSEQTLAGQISNTQQFIICYDDALPVGFAAFSKTDEDVIKLHKLYILPEQQGKGIGKFMIGHIAAICKAEHIPILELNVNRYNDAAKAFYEKNGFVVYREEDIDIGSGYFMNDYVLRLVL